MALTERDFIKKINEKGYSYSRHQAMSGSQYWTVLGTQYRLSDHFNPNKLSWVTSPVEVSSYESILKRADEDFKKKNQTNTTDEYIYDESSDGFYKNPNYKK